MKRTISGKGVGLLAAVAFGLMLSTPAHAQTVVNGNFSTGDLTGFTVFTTSGGTNGSLSGNPLPDVVSFNVNGSGATNAARFRVGESSFNLLKEGGGILQDINFSGGGLATFSADIAAQGMVPQGNAEAGIFELFVDGVSLNSIDFGIIGAGAIDRATLSGSVLVGAGSHELRIQITRPFTNDNSAPLQYVTNLRVAGQFASSTPEGSSLLLMVSGLLPLAAVAQWRHRRARG